MKSRSISLGILLSLSYSINSYSIDIMPYLDQLASWFQSLASFQANPVVPAAPAPNQHYTLSARQLDNYLDSYFATLGHELYPAAIQTDIVALRTRTNQKIAASTTVYIWVSGVRFYNKDTVDSLALESIVEYITDNSYTLAYNQTFNTTLSRKVAQSIKQAVQAKINSMSYLDCNQLKTFFGPGLTSLVRQRINQIDTPYQPTYTQPSQPSYVQPQPQYTSATCCICMEPFGGATTQRVYLKPCGHDICQSCALDWFFPNDMPDKTRTCPHCRSSINFDALFNDLGL